MKRRIQIMAGVSAVSLLAVVVQVRGASITNLEETSFAREYRTQARVERLNGAIKANDVIGMTVKNYQDEKLGKIEDLAVDVESGRVVQVILSTGGFFGSAYTALPPGALRYDAALKIIRLDASLAKLTNAPKFDLAKWDESTRSNQVVEVYSYYSVEPYFLGDARIRNSNMDTDRNAQLPLNMDGTLNTDAPHTVDQVHNREIARNLEDNARTNADGTWTRQRSWYVHGDNSWSSPGSIQKASKVRGLWVKNLQDEKLGKIENLMVDLSASRIVAVVISSGGFMGMGNELSAVPPGALRFDAEHDVFQLDASKEVLVNSPHFQASRWPDLGEPRYAGGVYRAYHVEPYFTTDADNTQRNIRDRDSKTLTPLDQGNSQADISTTAQIRREIIADKGMSTNAKNVKIITIDGRVTLRGPVATAQEKQRISDIAERIARSGNVDNQLEVTASTSSNN